MNRVKHLVGIRSSRKLKKILKMTVGKKHATQAYQATQLAKEDPKKTDLDETNNEAKGKTKESISDESRQSSVSTSRLTKPMTIGNVNINDARWQTLLSDNLLDDCIIDGFFLAAAHGAISPASGISVHSLKAMEKIAPTRELTRSLQERYNDLISAKVLFIPFNTCHYDNVLHWALFVVIPEAKRIVYVDTLTPKSPSGRALKHVMAMVALCKGPRTWAGWKVVVPNQDRQLDTTSCGVFVCHTVASACSGDETHVPNSKEGQAAFVRMYRSEMRTRLNWVCIPNESSYNFTISFFHFSFAFHKG